MDVGFIGLGAMGVGMANNLLKAGHRLTVWNRSPDRAKPLEAAGATIAASPADAFKGDALISMLADDDAYRQIILSGGALDQAKQGLVHVVAATISVALAQELAAEHAKRGLGYVAAPVFGRPDAAEKAMLHVVAAGAPSALERVRPLLEAIGQKVWPLGDEPHRANVLKIAGNFMIASAIEAMGEATALGEAYGVPASAILDVLTNTLFSAPIYKNYGAQIAEQRYEPAGFKLTLGLKDIRLALAAGEAQHVPLPLASLLRDGFLEAIASGASNKDWAALADVSLRRSGQKT